jgi:hypothetical protein
MAGTAADASTTTVSFRRLPVEVNRQGTALTVDVTDVREWTG